MELKSNLIKYSLYAQTKFNYVMFKNQNGKFFKPLLQIHQKCYEQWLTRILQGLFPNSESNDSSNSGFSKGYYKITE